MPKNACKLCCRRFASPRALAGHMRSHSVATANAAAAAAVAAATKLQISSASSASTSFTAADEEEEEDVGFKKPLSIYTLRENPKRSLRVSEYAFSDRESEAESTPTPAAKSARTGDGEPMSSLSYVGTPEEEVALALMMLSRDTWPSVGRRGGGEYSDDGSDDCYALPPPSPAPAPLAEKRTRFQCPACKKVFRSYQALGGHRASHVRGGRGGCCAPPLAPPPPPPPQPQPPLPEHEADEEDMDGKAVPHECPYCYRVFSSGQALGGHKRSHLCSAAAAAAHAQTAGASPPSQAKILGMIDLNIAPPVDEVELSAVSDPHFPNNPCL
ncbi:zinc finger protein ZAT1-like [Oryza brachyantha]|uniref:zinc finger protein ZAT1-like n=1 Tax=Oryza brachyantha TaxID=4533 RepID=UPI001ADADBA9|nr:zinc finger protein ZAT1-like [Oryza brachyantha]